MVTHSAAGVKDLGFNSPVARAHLRFNSRASGRQAVLAMSCTVATNCDCIMQCTVGVELRLYNKMINRGAA